MNYKEMVEYLYDIPRFTKEKSRMNLSAILAIYGNPQDSFKYIHVAGTNGKGSVCAYLASAIQEGGYKTGLFTSPHLVRLNERFQVDGQEIADDELTGIFQEVLGTVKERQRKGYPHPTYFEFLYIIAMIYFSRKGVEVGVIETGLGGRLDATNVIKSPCITVITAIGLDHTAILGDNIRAITGEKAGIMKKNIPVVYWNQSDEVRKVVERRARMLDCPGFPVGADQSKKVNRDKTIDFSYESLYHERYSIHLNTSAVYQTDNACLALQTLEVLNHRQDICLTKEQCVSGIEKMVWPGRMEMIEPGVFVDGAHNEDGIECFARSVDVLDEDIYLLFAVCEDKDYATMIRRLCRLRRLKGVIVTALEGGRKKDPKEISKIFEEYWHGSVKYTYNIKEALRYGKSLLKDKECLYCLGSLYLVGAIKDTGGTRDD